MLGERESMDPELFVACSLRDLIPEDYILNKVDRVLDLSWLREEVGELYCADNGRPSIDPEAAVRLMPAGFFHGIVHDRKLLREARMHIGIRWFAGFALHESLPDHSSLTRVRQRWGPERFRRIFERTVAQCMAAGLVGGETVHIDATLIRADVSWESLTTEHADKVLEGNNALGESSDHDDKQKDKQDDDRSPRGRGRRSGRARKKKRSRTDPECTLTTSNNRFVMTPSYKQHTAVDDRAGVVVDAEVTTGEASEGKQLIEQVDRVSGRLGNKPGCVTADAGYGHGRNWEALEARGIDAVIVAPKVRARAMGAGRFKFDARHEVVKCPRGRALRAKGGPNAQGYTVFRSRRSDCLRCPLRQSCVTESTGVRTIGIGAGHEALTRARRRHARGEPCDRERYRRHRWMVEGRHGEAKTQHGLGRAVRRGLDNVRIQAYLTAAVMNLKRLAHCRGADNTPPGGRPGSLGQALCQIARAGRRLLEFARQLSATIGLRPAWT